MRAVLFTLVVAWMVQSALGDSGLFQLGDVFDLEYATDPQIAPDGGEIIYVRNFMDRMKDRKRSSLWRVAVDGSGHRPVTTADGNESSPRFSPRGSRLLYLAKPAGGSSEQTQVSFRSQLLDPDG